jgi:hypothetical protein
VIVLGAGGLIWIRIAGSVRVETVLRYCFVLAILAEELFYMNTRHPIRSDRDIALSPILTWLKERVPGGGAYRVFNLGAGWRVSKLE